MTEILNTQDLRDIFSLALNRPQEIVTMQITKAHLAAAIDAATCGLVPIKDLPDEEKARASKALYDAIRPIGAKIMPLASPDQGEAWLVAVVAGLSDLPRKVVVRAALDALHKVFSFPNQVEAAIREAATAALDRQRAAISLLERMKNGLTPRDVPAITRQPQPWTVERLLGTPSYMIRLGVNSGFIPQELVDQAFPDGLQPDDAGKMSCDETGSAGK